MSHARKASLFSSQSPKALDTTGKATLAKILVTFFIVFSLIFGQSLVFANTTPANGVISVTVLPSANPLSKEYVQALHDTQYKMINAGYKMDDLNKVYLAVDNRDQAWATAVKILQGIQSGQINNRNITKYATDEFKSEIITQPLAISSMLGAIKSLGSRATLSTQSMQGKSPDYMVVQMKPGQDKINIAVVNRVDRVSTEQINSGEPFAELTITLSSQYPFKNWFLAGIHVLNTKVIHPS